jgi:hypothetical protein
MSGEFPSPRDWFASLNKNVQQLLREGPKGEIDALYKNAKQQYKADQAQAALHSSQILARINPDDVRNITALNEIIPITLEGQVGGPETEAQRTTQSMDRQRGKDIPKIVGRIFPEQCRGGAAGSSPACDWPVIESSGDSNDCLIHSFLTATCPNFRRLRRPQKEQFAHSFRVDLLPKYPEIQAYIEGSTPDNAGRTAHDRLFGEFFLGDEDLQAICRVFRVNVVIVQGARRVGRHTDPAMMISFIEYDDERVFFIYNNGTNHFESIRPSRSYYLTQAEAQVAIAPFSAQTGEETKPQCDYTVGDEVEYRGKKYRVTGTVYGNSNANGVIRCRAVKLDLLDGAAEITVPVTDLAKNTAHVRASGEAMAAGPGPEHLRPNTTRKPRVLKASIDKLIREFGITEDKARHVLENYPPIERARQYLRKNTIRVPPSYGPIVGKPPHVFKTFANHLIETFKINENTARKVIHEHTFFLDPNAAYNKKDTEIKAAEKALMSNKKDPFANLVAGLRLKGGHTRKRKA